MMEISIFLAKAFSLYFIVVGVAMLFYRDYYLKAATEMLKNPGIAFLTSIFTLILGILLILFHNTWEANWTVIITILAWLTFIKGVVRLFLPTKLASWDGVIKNNVFFYVTIIITIALGIYLAWMGCYSGS